MTRSRIFLALALGTIGLATASAAAFDLDDPGKARDPIARIVCEDDDVPAVANCAAGQAGCCGCGRLKSGCICCDAGDSAACTEGNVGNHHVGTAVCE